MVERGHLLLFEGVDGAGKTSQATLLKEYLGPVAVLEPEPTRSDLGRWIRRELQTKTTPNRELQNRFIDNRVEHFQRLNRLLANGITVIMDRGEVSTAAYGAASGDFTIEEVMDIHRRADIPKPDSVLYLRLTDAEAHRRRTERKDGKERFDDAEFQRKLAATYERIKGMGVYRWIDIDASKRIEGVHQEVLRVLRELNVIRGGQSSSCSAKQAIRFNLAETSVAMSISCRVSLHEMVVDRYMSCDRVRWVKAEKPPAELIDAAGKLARFVEKVSKEVQNRWFADKLTSKNIYGLLLGEAGELGEYIIKEKRDRRDYHDEIAAESVDLIFYLVKAVTDSKIDIEKAWGSLAFNARRQRELELLGDQKGETIALALGFICASLGALSENPNAKASINIGIDPEGNEGGNGNNFLFDHYRRLFNIGEDQEMEKVVPHFDIYPLSFTFETGCMIALYLALKLIEKLDIDFDKAWENKMDFNDTRFKDQRKVHGKGTAPVGPRKW